MSTYFLAASLLMVLAVAAAGRAGRVGPGLAAVPGNKADQGEPLLTPGAAIAAAAAAVLGTFNPSSANHSTLTQVTAGPNDCRTVAFTVAKVNYQRRKAGTTGTQVVFDDIVTSVGQGWDAASSSFRCSCPGTYFFTFHVLSPAQGRARVDLMRNTRRVISTEANYGGFDTGSNSAVLQLVGGDVIYLWLAEGYLYENDARFRGFNSLSAYKIG